MEKYLTKDSLDRFAALIGAARRVAIVCHMSPDGDALGSSLCLMQVLRSMGKHASVMTPDSPPRTLSFLPGFEDITVVSYHADRARYNFSNADVIVCLDFNDLKRVDRTAPLIEASKARRIMIDHHLNPTLDAEVMISVPQKSSTCMLLFEVLRGVGLDRFVDREGATCCIAGMMTDTGNFSYNANDPEIYRVLAELMERGVDKTEIYNRLFNTVSLKRFRIMAYAQYARTHVMPEHSCAIITLSRDDLHEFGYTKGDTEGLVNTPLAIPGIVYSIFLREDTPNYVKVSMRSKGNFSVKKLCEEHLGGGGHLNAAGGDIHKPLDQALPDILALLPEADEMLLGYSKKN